MPIAIEVTLLALLAYGVGLAIGWAMWSGALFEMGDDE